MFRIKKLFVASLATAALVFSASICAAAAQIDRLSIVDNTIYAQVSAENARLYAVEGSEGLLSDAFFADADFDGNVELPVGKASEYALYLWDRDSLAPISVPYVLRDGIAYPEGSNTPVPGYEFSGYSFNQDDAVMVVSAINDTEIKGFKAGAEATYLLTDNIEVLGLSDNIDDVVPGSVVLLGTNKAGQCAAIELLASIGWPIDEDAFKADYGVYSPADGSTQYKNIVNITFSKFFSKLTLTNRAGATYFFESTATKCYRVGIATLDGEPIVTVEDYLVSGQNDNSAFKDTSKFNNYVYLRIDTDKSTVSGGTTYNGVITQCIVYAVPKELNFNPDNDDDKYSPIFGLEPIVIID